MRTPPRVFKKQCSKCRSRFLMPRRASRGCPKCGGLLVAGTWKSDRRLRPASPASVVAPVALPTGMGELLRAKRRAERTLAAIEKKIVENQEARREWRKRERQLIEAIALEAKRLSVNLGGS